MTGIIVTGHGRFAEGVASAVSLIAGEQEEFIPVCFEHEVNELEEDLKDALKRLEMCEGILIFCDLAGGTPFKTAVMLTREYENIEVIAGANLPMLAETVLLRNFTLSLRQLCADALKTGKEQIVRFDASLYEPQNEEEKEGI